MAVKMMMVMRFPKQIGVIGNDPTRAMAWPWYPRHGQQQLVEDWEEEIG